MNAGPLKEIRCGDVFLPHDGRHGGMRFFAWGLTPSGRVEFRSMKSGGNVDASPDFHISAHVGEVLAKWKLLDANPVGSLVWKLPKEVRA